MQSQSITASFPTVSVAHRPMANEIVPAERADARAVLAQVADAYARQSVFDDFLSRKAENTIRAQRADLETFSEFLYTAEWPNPPDGATLQIDAAAWQGVTHGLVTAFRNWQLQRGYAVATVNRQLATVRKYCKLAFTAGVIDETTHALITTVQGYAGKDAMRMDERRQESGVATRMSNKKAEHISITDEQAEELKNRPRTPQGRRDRLMMCLLLDHGLRVGEVARLKVSDFDLQAGELVFYRPKVDRTQRHKLTADTLRAVQAWIDSGDCPVFDDAPLLRGSRKSGELTEAGMTERSISARVRTLGIPLGFFYMGPHVTDGGKEKDIQKGTLSAHDCRHYWATRWAGKVDIFRLQEAGGWASLAMPRRYTEWAAIANEGMA